MRPCDCRDRETALEKLNEQGIGFNDNGIMLEPNTVVIKQDRATIRIPMHHFKAYAEWYLADQILTEPPVKINPGPIFQRSGISTGTSK